jgi:pyridoxine 4-dehydrogenase
LSENGLSVEVAGTITIGGDLTVNRLAFGAMRLCGEGIWGEPEDRESVAAVLRRTLELGIDFIDTADAYGPEANENQISGALHPYPEGLVIATKGGQVRSGPGVWEPDGRPEHLKEACEGSLRRLKVERIDLYQLHRPDPDVPFEESVGALAELREEGKVRHVGLSNVSVEQLEAALEVVPVVSVQNRYNLSDRASEDVLKACEERGIAFLPWAPLAGDTPELREIAEQRGATTGQVSIAWLLGHSPAMLPIPGTSSVTHLEENVAAADLRLSDEEMARLSG